MLSVSLDTRDSHRVHSGVDLSLQDSVLELRGPLGGRLEETGGASWDRGPTSVGGRCNSLLPDMAFPSDRCLSPCCREPKATARQKAWSIEE